MTSPLVHPVYSRTTNTWQYVVADPESAHCIVLDPVRDRNSDRASLTTEAADAVLELIAQHGYIADLILDTNASETECLSAAWYVRMQLYNKQGAPPRLCTDAGVPGLDAMWQRKYGTGMSTTITPGLRNEEIVQVDSLSVECMVLPRIGARQGYAYRIGNELFGAHAFGNRLLALPGSKTPKAREAQEPGPTDDAAFDAWTKLQRFISLPGGTRVWHTEALGPSSSDGSLSSFDRLSHYTCNTNSLAGISQAEFLFNFRSQYEPDMNPYSKLSPGAAKKVDQSATWRPASRRGK